VQLLVVLAEFGCSPEGEAELRKHLERTLAETRATPGCLQATLWERPGERRFLFTTYWTDAAAVTRWVERLPPHDAHAGLPPLVCRGRLQRVHARRRPRPRAQVRGVRALDERTARLVGARAVGVPAVRGRAVKLR
jgi:quinol monooxygenase YgiN